jgi:hypothetical protein
MQVIVLLLLGTFILGGTRLGPWVRERPFVLLVLCSIAAASFYSLRVVL